MAKSVLAAQNGRCWICDKSMKKPPKTPEGWRSQNTAKVATQDHVIPRSILKGAGLVNNKLWAHQACNSRRGNQLPSDEERYKARMIMIGAVAYQLSNKGVE